MKITNVSIIWDDLPTAQRRALAGVQMQTAILGCNVAAAARGSAGNPILPSPTLPARVPTAKDAVSDGTLMAWTDALPPASNTAVSTGRNPPH